MAKKRHSLIILALVSGTEEGELLIGLKAVYTADSGTLLNILTRASCFPDSVRSNAARVRDGVRNSWAHGRYKMWTRETYTGALAIVLDLITELPDHESTVENLEIVHGMIL